MGVVGLCIRIRKRTILCSTEHLQNTHRLTHTQHTRSHSHTHAQTHTHTHTLTVTQLMRTWGERLMSGKVWFRIILILSLRADVVPMAQQEPQSEGRGGEEVHHPLRAVSMQRRPVSCSPLTLRNVLIPVDRGKVQSSHGPRVIHSRQGTRGGTDVRRKGLH